VGINWYVRLAITVTINDVTPLLATSRIMRLYTDASVRD
jgi:hypothetical protein